MAHQAGRKYFGLEAGKRYVITYEFETSDRGNVKLEVADGAYDIAGDFKWAE